MFLLNRNSDHPGFDLDEATYLRSTGPIPLPHQLDFPHHHYDGTRRENVTAIRHAFCLLVISVIDSSLINKYKEKGM
jgi:hypothetical protein